MDSSPYQLGHDPDRYPIEQVLEVAERASSLQPDAIPELIQAMNNEDSTIRYWGALGILMQGGPAVSESHKELVEACSDFSPYVRITAAQALGQYGRPEDLSPSLALLVAHANGDSQNCFVVMAALNSLGALGSKASPVADEIAALPTEAPYPADRYSGYVIRLHTSLNDSLKLSRTQPTD
jgi:HEAT repeat protein